MPDKLVEEKQEDKKTLAKAGAFWSLLLVPIYFFVRMLRRRN